MIRPRLRPLELFPARVDGQDLFCLRDPSGLATGMAFLPQAAALVAALCDGTRSVDEVAQEFGRRTGIEVGAEQVTGLVEQLDQALFLDSPHFASHELNLFEEFRATPVRPARHAGASYPADAAELAGFLDAPAAAVEPRPTAMLIAPHIDFHRGAPVYALAYRALPEPPELVVVFGTDHNGADQPFTLTRKHYDTPFGAVETEIDLVDHLARAGGAGLFADELHHRHEHSIEFQAVWLRHLFGARTPPMLPVLCGSLHRHVAAGSSPRRDPRIADFLAALARAVDGKKVLVVAGADLSHVGPRFGDSAPGDRAAVEKANRQALAAAGAGDAEGFFAAVAADHDRFRVCGLAPIYHSLVLARGGPGSLLGYQQCAADEDDTSFVSIAAMTL